MPIDVSHFTIVGFQLDLGNQAQFAQDAVKLTSACRPAHLTATDVVCLIKDGSGAELRIGLQLKEGRAAEIATMNPGYVGEGRASLDIAANVSDPDEAPFEVTVSARFSGQATPIVFELADPLTAGDIGAGRKVVVDIAAFSFKPELFDDEASYFAAQRKSGSKVVFAADAFVPTGMFFEKAGGAMPDDAKRPIAYADFAGQIVKCELRENAIGKGRFWWAVVKTYGDTTVDVVIDPTTIAGDPKVGEIVSGRFWLTAHLVTPSKP